MVGSRFSTVRAKAFGSFYYAWKQNRSLTMLGSRIGFLLCLEAEQASYYAWKQNSPPIMLESQIGIGKMVGTKM